MIFSDTNQICSDTMEEIAEKAEYLLAKPSDDCKVTKMTVEDYGVRVNIDHLPADLSCVLQFENHGNFSSSLRFKSDGYSNIEAHVFETDEKRSFFEPRGKFSSLDDEEFSEQLNDFHIWYANTSFVVLTAKDPNKGPAVFKALVTPLRAPKEDMPHILDYLHKDDLKYLLCMIIMMLITVLLSLL
mmetsp:Transcript_40041/g.39644  ORF Transcript_40041/g.39644 Transcript_40041/m.39644 type:complete len:186 (+) Transcript_40041:167-724(+)